jgi:aspartyl-tRNA(Asn)/glutamyl-tRNA(Gln) amidotransferase subunit B
MIRTGEDPGTIVERQGLVQVTDVAAVGKAVDAVIAAHRAQVQKYAEGNDTLFTFFVGETMKIMKGKGNPRVVNDVLRRTLDVLRK